MKNTLKNEKKKRFFKIAPYFRFFFFIFSIVLSCANTVLKYYFKIVIIKEVMIKNFGQFCMQLTFTLASIILIT